MSVPSVLSVAGSDSSGGAGIQADLKTMCAHGVYGMTAVTAVTVQNTRGVTDILEVPPHLIAGQINAVFSDLPVGAVKTGMVCSPDAIDAIIAALQRNAAPFLVVDPVMAASSGYPLLRPESGESLRRLLSAAYLVTPNLAEAEFLCGFPVNTPDDMEKAARNILQTGPQAVLLKGGHLADTADDYLLTHEQGCWIQGRRIDAPNNHGTGCTLSAAIACDLAAGMTLHAAVTAAKAFLTHALQNALDIGNGPGPLGHFAPWNPPGDSQCAPSLG